MTLVKRACAAATILVIAIALALTILSQRVVHADTVPVSGSEIVCQVYEYLVSQGLPIPQGLDASGCDGNSGGGDPQPGNTQCSNLIDDDGDGKIDYLPDTNIGDPDCSSASDDSEAPDTTNGGGDTGGGGGSGGSGDNGGGGSGTGVGGAAPACEDNIDNDGDGLIDEEDPGCDSAADTDEADPVADSEGDGALDGEGTLSSSSDVVSVEEVAVAEAEEVVAPTCDWYLTGFIKRGGNNDPEQVRRLQTVLHDIEGADVEVSGEYDEATYSAVHAFQSKYASEILAPWHETRSTGFVYLTTRKKINELYCSTKDFSLTADEENLIAQSLEKRSVVGSTSVVPVNAQPGTEDAHAPVGVEPITGDEITNDVMDIVGSAQKDNESQVAAVQNADDRPLDRIWRPISNLFSRIFGR